LKEMAAKIGQHFFFDLVRELSDTPRIWMWTKFFWNV
jgi:hypothetical protein